MHLSLAQNLARGNQLADAKREFGTALQIFESMHADQSHPGPLLQMALCKVGLADVQLRSGELSGATSALREALTLAGAHTDPTDYDALRTVAAAYGGLGDVEFRDAERSPPPERAAHWRLAAQWYDQSLSGWNRVPARIRRAIDTPSSTGPESVAQNLQRAQMQLRNTRPGSGTGQRG
jgi:ATP/maltotriose-dependent transcriptional regulator MalT